MNNRFLLKSLLSYALQRMSKIKQFSLDLASTSHQKKFLSPREVSSEKLHSSKKMRKILIPKASDKGREMSFIKF